MRVNRSMFVGILALIAAVGMLGANGYYWWLAQSREALSLEASTKPAKERAQKPRTADPYPAEVWTESEVWDSPSRAVYREFADTPPLPEESPYPFDGNSLAQVDTLEPAPAEKQTQTPPPRLLPDAVAPLLQPPSSGDWLSQLVQQELPQATEEEIRVWQQELQGLEPEMARDILRLKKSVMRDLGPPRSETTPDWHDLSEPQAPLSEKLVPPPMEDLAGNAGSIANRLQPSLRALEQARDVILNNLANTHTPGFKRMRIVFATGPYRAANPLPLLNEADGDETPAVMLGTGVELGSTPLDVSQGPLHETRQPLDVAIQGEGFFQVRIGEKVRYTRSGLWTRNDNGQLCVRNAGKSCPIDPPVTVPQDSVSITFREDGMILSVQPGHDDFAESGQIQLARFVNPSGLMPCGGQMYSATEVSGKPILGTPGSGGLGTIRQGFLELSNVSRDEELEQFQLIQTHLQLLTQLANTPESPTVPGPVAQRSAGTKRAALERKILPPDAMESLKRLQDQGSNLIEDYLQSERMRTIKRTLGLK